jgi:prepilin-type N-terminal cleavage/methylation domain-containing protein
MPTLRGTQGVVSLHGEVELRAMKMHYRGIDHGLRKERHDVYCQSVRHRHPSKSDSGFTLIEILVALMVMSIAISIYVSLYSTSLDFASAARSELAAKRVAAEYLHELRTRADNFQWPAADAQPGGLYELKARGTEAPIHPDPPTVQATTQRASERDRTFYKEFSWRAFASVPADGANYYTVVVEVSWLDDQRLKYLTLSSCVPKPLAG